MKGLAFNIRNLCFCFLLLIICYSPKATAQNTVTNNEPKLGLVLSGGGAKGLAHIGVLKAMEQAGLQPDYITGTSMGSIIGGLYAAGYTADEIKEIALNADWDQLLSNKLLLNEVAYEEKDYYGRYINVFNITGNKIDIPEGLIEGQKLSMLLSGLTRHVMDIEEFRNLPVPYACMGADIVTGERVVLNSGSLARSMRASMAIPSVFTPVELDGRLLVDGGLVHNFPVDEVLQMGADYVIGVFVGSKLRTKEEMTSPVSILTQSAFLLGSFDNEKQKKLVNLYIEPELGSLSTQDFHQSKKIIEVGENTGKLFLGKFKELSDSLQNAGKKNIPVSRPEIKDSVFITKTVVENNKLIAETFIKKRLGIQDNSLISINELENKITHLYGTGYFSRILYELEKTADGNVLHIEVSETSEGKLKPAVQYNTETDLSLVLNITYRNLLLQASRFIAEGEISKYPLLDINYLKYFGGQQKTAISAGYYLRNSEVPDFDENNISNLYKYNYHKFHTSLHSFYNTSNALRITYAYENAGIKPAVGSAELFRFDNIIFKGHKLEMNYDHNSLDDHYFPKKGSRIGLTAAYTVKSSLGLDFIISDTLDPVNVTSESQGIFSGEIKQHSVYTIADKFTLVIKNRLNILLRQAGDTLSVGTGFFNQRYIGGFRRIAPNTDPFWGAEILRYYADNTFSNQLIIQYEIRRNLYLSLRSQYYLANPLAFLNNRLGEGEYYFGGRKHLFALGISIAYDTPVGPVSISVGKGNTGADLQYNFNFGFYLDRD